MEKERQEEGYHKKKLDRYVKNPKLISESKGVEFLHLIYHKSDHTQILATIKLKDNSKWKGPRKGRRL